MSEKCQKLERGLRAIPRNPLTIWSGRPDSNRRRPAWEAGILPLNYARKGPAATPPIYPRTPQSKGPGETAPGAFRDTGSTLRRGDILEIHIRAAVPHERERPPEARWAGVAGSR